MEELFEPESILDTKITSGRRFYLVKWKNFPMNKCTWEPTHHLLNCDNLIAEFEKSVTTSSEEQKLKKQCRKRKVRGQSMVLNPDAEGVYNETICGNLPNEKLTIARDRYANKYSNVVSLLCREQNSKTVQFRAKLNDGSFAWISNEDAHSYLKDQLISFYEQVLKFQTS
ncbi:unnamed protein product [Thelazia callipaeda]|uniref:Chromo domain-containing protein n=1 Tax=Thelazia callipaeda TaxID=103827 RepID=A0A0N5CWR1_THECL|nr:unnamed protein product [Thelazia callipaeda]